MKIKQRKRPLLVLAIILISFLLAGSILNTVEIYAGDTGDEVTKTGKAELTEFSDLSGKTVSMLTGAPFEELVRSKAPDVGEFTFFNNMPDMLLALQSGKTDAALINNAIGTLAVNRNEGLALFPQNLQDGAFGFAFAKGDPKRDEWQAAYDKISEEEKQKLWEKWTGSDESAKVVPKQDWPGKNGTVKAAVCDTLEPMSYAGEGGEMIGFDVEMILLIAKEMDVHVEFTGMEFSAILTSVQSGKADIGAGSIIVTPERAESVDFVEYYPAAFVLIVRGAQTGEETQSALPTLADIEHGRIAVTTGSVHGPLAEKLFPDAEVEYYNTQADSIAALKSGKVDVWISDEPVIRYAMVETPGLDYLDENLAESDLAAVFAKTEAGQALCDQYSDFIDKLWEDGTMSQIDDAWFGTDESKRTVIDYENLPATNGTLRMGADLSQPPFTYMQDGRAVGYDVDVAARFCEENGYRLEIESINFDGLLASVQSGKCDFADSCITITEERAESVLFSSPNYRGGVVAAVWKGEENADVATSDEEQAGSFWDSIVSSFEKTFIKEDRWKLFLEGILTTLLITMLSILFGTILGFLVFMLCRNGNPVANAITRFFVWLIKGMPVVVLLMILYYIIFGNVTISGTAVSVVGFTLVFGAGVYGTIKAGVAAIDSGQMEAAYALGYTNRKAFFRVILPQAMPHFMPAYKGSITELIKGTAIVGYVAVQDLTKIGDIIRSRTYEAFFPLIAVAVIYFILAGILTLIVKKIEFRIDPKQRKLEDIKKEVERL